MKKIKKLDDVDVVFIDKPLNEKEAKEFSKFLRERKAKIAAVKKTSGKAGKKVFV